MPWVNDPYQWMDPELGRKSVWVNGPEKPSPNAFKMHRTSKPANQSALRLSAKDTLLAYIRRYNVEVARARLVEKFDVTSLRDLSDDKLVDFIETFR